MLKKYLPLVWLMLFLLLIYTRFVNLGWGLPYPMHPDERNMVDAVMKMRCDDFSEFLGGVISNVPVFIRTTVLGELMYVTGNMYTRVSCGNPGFFAYGQSILYAGYFLAYLVEYISRLFSGDTWPVYSLSFSSVAIALRIISALSSVMTVVVVHRIWTTMRPKIAISQHLDISFFLLLTFSPILIQFAHFGTTESFLSFMYALVAFLSLRALGQKKSKFFFAYMTLSVLSVGVAISAKVSSLIFLIVPFFAIITRYGSGILANTIMAYQGMRNISRLNSVDVVGVSTQVDNVFEMFYRSARHLVYIFLWVGFSTFLALLVSFFLSPHNVISYPEFAGSFSYERDVGTGRYVAFYTRQFLHELPLVFHIRSVFPYVLGVFASTFAAIGLFTAFWNKSNNLIRFSVIGFCVLTMPWYAKWSRFIAPVYPLLLIFTMFGIMKTLKVLFAYKLPKIANQIIATMITFLTISVGIGYLSVYSNTDVRYQASKWVYENVPSGSKVLSETANVIDVPIPDPSQRKDMYPGYRIDYVSFDYYALDENDEVYRRYRDYLAQADYIFVPSRRVFYNHTCISEKGGEIARERHSDYKCKKLEEKYPRLKKHYEELFSGRLGFEKVAEFSSFPRITLFGKTIWEFADESAEETFTVFDHPVIRIYKRQSPKL